MGTHTKQFYKNDALALTVNGVDYTVDVTAHADYYYDAGRMYMRNGDPGYPPESEFEIEDVDAVWYDADGKKVDAITEEMTDALNDALEDVDGWEDCEYEDEPDYDYYEEREIAKYEADCARMGY
jgi:hypothetical protein